MSAATQPATQLIPHPSLRDVLFMTDFSPCSELAAPFARAIARQFGSTIHALHIVSPRPVVIGGEFGGAGIELEFFPRTPAGTPSSRTPCH